MDCVYQDLDYIETVKKSDYFITGYYDTNASFLL